MLVLLAFFFWGDCVRYPNNARAAEARVSISLGGHGPCHSVASSSLRWSCVLAVICYFCCAELDNEEQCAELQARARQTIIQICKEEVENITSNGSCASGLSRQCCAISAAPNSLYDMYLACGFLDTSISFNLSQAEFVLFSLLRMASLPMVQG